MKALNAIGSVAVLLLAGTLVTAQQRGEEKQQEKQGRSAAPQGRQDEPRQRGPEAAPGQQERQNQQPRREAQPQRQPQERAQQSPARQAPPEARQQTQQPEPAQRETQPQRQPQAQQPSPRQAPPLVRQQPQQTSPQPHGRAQQEQARQFPQPARQQMQPQRTRQQAQSWQQQRGWQNGGGPRGYATFAQARTRNWSSDHRTWGQRGGYGGAFIPQAVFGLSFGSRHFFRIGIQPVMYQGYPRFSYGGYSFLMVDPWPGDWSDNWYADDDVYIDYYDDGYYLMNRRYPDDRLAITIIL